MRAFVATCGRHGLLGFDYRAQRTLDVTLRVTEVLRIEVNGYSYGNPIQLDHSYWTKAQQLGETYWLYVVWSPRTPDYRLVKIQSPYRVLEHAVKHREVIRRYEIPVEAINGYANSPRN